VPLWQKCEQQSPSTEHVFPDVEQAALSATHLLFVQMPPQHSLSCEHDWPSETHWLPLHLPLTHENEQQSGPD
jgi:hypothetical protein